jgi:A/G-specific adenine glycosylase
MRATSALGAETRPAADRGDPAKHALSAPSIKDVAPFRRALLRWYDLHHRDLPWRNTRDPYSIWLSEIMLQQTRVAAVLEHYRIFLQRFPDLQALATASEESVLAAWSGLGYYRRARRLHQCARQITELHGGCFPRNSKTLLTLPGIGRYTAAALASIVFAEPVAVVDGNVERVLQRVLGVNLSTQQTWQHAQRMLPNSRPGDFNQAMMELGATVCGPRAPRCPECPVRKWCATRGEVPRVKSAPRQAKKQIWCVLDCRNLDWRKHRSGEIRMVQRPNKVSLMPGMWELPQISEPRRLTRASTPWRTFRHSITTTDYTVHVIQNTLVRGRSPDRPAAGSTSLPRNARKGNWIPVDCISQRAITGLTRKILKAGGII